MPDPRIALVKANQVRTQRKELREEVIAGSQKLSDILRNPPEYIWQQKVGRVLEWLPGMGPRKAQALLGDIWMHNKTQLGVLSPNRLSDLAQQVEEIEEKRK